METTETKGKTVARHMSRLFHPLLIPAYSLLMFFSISFMQMLPTFYEAVVLATTLVLTIVVPLASLLLLVHRGRISSIDLPEQQDRTLPYLICSTSLMACAIALSRLGIYSFVYGTIFSGAMCMIVCALINMFALISIHAAALGCWLGCAMHVWGIGPVAMLTGSNMTAITIITLLTGATASLRVASGQRTLDQALGGMLCGFACGFGIMFLFEY